MEDTGMKSLMVFVGLAMVAALTAGIVMQDAENDGITGLAVGAQPISVVSDTLELLSTSLDDDSSMDIVFKLGSAYGSLQLDTMLIRVNKEVYEYGGVLTGECDESVGVGSYYVSYVQTGNDYREGFLRRGDIVEACVVGLVDDVAAVDVLPGVGSGVGFDAEVPSFENLSRVFLYPKD